MKYLRKKGYLKFLEKGRHFWIQVGFLWVSINLLYFYYYFANCYC